jgi:signal transduction histidine kinase
MDAEDLKMQPSPHLTDQQWQAVEKLNDILANASDLQNALSAGLELLLSTLGGTAAALFLPHIGQNISAHWTFAQIDPSSQEDLQHKLPPYYPLIEQVMAHGAIQPGSLELDLAGIFPIGEAENTIGALLVMGPVAAAETYRRWLVFLRPIHRIITLYSRATHELANMPSYGDLINSRNTLRALFDSLPISIYIIDNTYRLVAVNNSRANRADDLPRLLVGGKCYEKLYRRSSPCPTCQAATTLTTGQNTTRLHRDWLDHDTFIEWEINTFPIQTETETPAQIIIVEADVTEKRNLEANLVQSEKLAAVGQLAAGVAHEINNPLTAIIANVQLLRRDINPAEIDLLDSVKLIETASTRAQQVIRNLLGIARKERYQFDAVDLNETLQNALSLVQHELVGRPIQVQLNFADDLPPLRGSQDQLQGVWINLFLNALDAIDKNNGHISVSSCFTGSEFQVIVQDNGKGVRPEHLERVFEPFFTTKSSGRGTGLGLSVCLRVIRQHGGNIQVESEPGSWTRFTVRLPQT